MEYRKLISFGKSSYVVSLPKAWVTHNKLNKGDLIYIDESGPNLILSKKDTTNVVDAEKTHSIDVDGQPFTYVEREVNASYILNCKSIVLKGKELPSRIREFHRIFQNLIALEVMEQGSDHMVAKDFLNMDQVSIDETLRKMDMVIRTIFSESWGNFDENTAKTIDNRDIDVNRLYFLLYRAVLYNLDHPFKAIKNVKQTPIYLLNSLFAGYFLEAISDEIGRINSYASKIDLKKKNSEALKKLLQRCNKYYLDTMKVFNSKDQKEALILSLEKQEVLDLVRNFQTKTKEDHYSGSLVTRVDRLVSYIHHLGRLVYQGYNY